MPYSAVHTCKQCGTEFQAASHSSAYCGSECRLVAHRDRRRQAPLPEKQCENCGDTFQPRRKGDVTCGPECASKRYNNSRSHGSADDSSQMEKLFRYYKARESIEITEAPEGTRVLALSDMQIPFMDQPLLDTIESFIDDWKPNVIIYVGDVLDAYSISQFDQRPARLFHLGDELDLAKDMLARHKRLSPTADLYWVDGNHEERLQRIIWKQAQDFSFLVKDIPEALELDRLTSGYVPYGKHVDFLGFIFTHGTLVRQNSAYTARAMLDRYRSSGASGHTHRAGSHSATDHRGFSHTWYEMGSLCIKSMDYIKAHPNWQSAFLTGTVFHGALHPQLIRVIERADGRGFVGPNGNYYNVGT